MVIQEKELSNYIFCALNSSINESITELLLCWKYGKKITHNDLSLKQKKLSHLIEQYIYHKSSKEKIEKNNFYLRDTCSNGYETIVQCLVEYGADVQKNKGVLELACINGHETIVKCLVEHGADVQVY